MDMPSMAVALMGAYPLGDSLPVTKLGLCSDQARPPGELADCCWRSAGVTVKGWAWSLAHSRHLMVFVFRSSPAPSVKHALIYIP